MPPLVTALDTPVQGLPQAGACPIPHVDGATTEPIQRFGAAILLLKMSMECSSIIFFVLLRPFNFNICRPPVVQQVPLPCAHASDTREDRDSVSVDGVVWKETPEQAPAAPQPDDFKCRLQFAHGVEDPNTSFQVAQGIVAPELAYFLLFFPLTLAHAILSATNSESNINLTLAELYIFLALLLAMSFIDTPRQRDHWTVKPEHPILPRGTFGQYMSCSRFEEIFKNLRFGMVDAAKAAVIVISCFVLTYADGYVVTYSPAHSSLQQHSRSTCSSW